MVEKKSIKVESKKKITHYSDAIKARAVQLYREGKSVFEIVGELNARSIIHNPHSG